MAPPLVWAENPDVQRLALSPRYRRCVSSSDYNPAFPLKPSCCGALVSWWHTLETCPPILRTSVRSRSGTMIQIKWAPTAAQGIRAVSCSILVLGWTVAAAPVCALIDRDATPRRRLPFGELEHGTHETLSRCFRNRRQPVRTSCVRQRCLGSQGAGLRSYPFPSQKYVTSGSMTPPRVTTAPWLKR